MPKVATTQCGVEASEQLCFEKTLSALTDAARMLAIKVASALSSALSSAMSHATCRVLTRRLLRVLCRLEFPRRKSSTPTSCGAAAS